MFFSSCPLKLVHLLKIPQGQEKKEAKAEARTTKFQSRIEKTRKSERKKNRWRLRMGCEGKKKRGYEFLGWEKGKKNG